jgi:tRNA A-37 threonylcarbamoyl transferase component Bud32
MVSNFSIFDLGRSGCNLHLHKDKLTIRKTSKNLEYNQRLYKQYQKQKKFTSVLNFIAPAVYNFNTTETLWNFDMDYIQGSTFFDFCNNSNVKLITQFCEELIGYLKHAFENSIETEINFSKLENKLLCLKKELKNVDCYLEYLLSNPIEKLYIGNCHGDFTLSNIIFSGKYYIIDFLDNIYETPLVDLIKIKQDVEHNFYCTLIKTQNSKLKICLDYINSRLNETFASIINDHRYVWFSVFNLLRILPYLEDQKEIDITINNLKKYEHYITSSR